MYVARFEDGGGSWLQGLVELNGPWGGSAGARPFADVREALARSVETLEPLGTSLRVVVGERGDVQVALSVVVPARSEPLLRRWLAGFMRLERWVRDAASIPATRADYDDSRRRFPDLRARLAPPTHSANGCWLACRGLIFEHLSDLVQEAQTLHIAFGYQINLRPLAVSADMLRAARRNLLGLSGAVGIPDALLALQRERVDRLASATAIAQELVAVASPEGAQWLACSIRDRFALLQGANGLSPPEVAFAAGAFADEIELGLHRSLLEDGAIDAAELASTGVDGPFCDAVLGWFPAGGEAVAVEPLRDEDGGAAAGFPPAARSTDNFVFVSYRRADTARLAPLVQMLANRGIAVWHDQGIAGGAEWDAVIEDRIEACDALVVFLTRDAVQSKFVRREVKYADALDKTIVAVVVEPVRLDHGLRMLLQQYEMVSGPSDEIDRRLVAALSRLTGCGAAPLTGRRGG